MPGIIKGVKSDQVRIQQRPQDLLSNRQSLVNLRGWEWGMKEKPELHPIEPLPQKCGEDHEMIIMDPNKILIRVDDFKDPIHEDLIHRNIRLKQASIKSSR